MSNVFVFLSVGPSLKNGKMVVVESTRAFELENSNPRLCLLSTSFVTVGKLLNFSKLQCSYLRPGTNNTVEQL